jgi:predicted DNA-binding transcriptional regulator YafY
MRRTDRLFDLIQILRDGQLHTAREMAEQVEVSVRTLWRDMASLQASGLPVDGERGVGYILRETIDLPPLSLTPDEIEALRLGAALVARGADPSLARAAQMLRAKVESVLPDRWRLPPATDGPFIFTGRETEDSAIHLPPLRHALRERLRVRLVYRDAAGSYSTRLVRPLQLEFWGRVWTLAAWCETRGDFRSFRLDRIEQLIVTDGPFAAEPGRELADYMARHDRPPSSDGRWNVEDTDQDWGDDTAPPPRGPTV